MSARARYLVRLAGGSKVHAVEVEFVPGWIHVQALVTEIVDEGDVGRRVPVGVAHRTYPAEHVLRVDRLELGEAA